MSIHAISAPPITTESFAQFGEVIEITDGPFVLINEGKCQRYSDLASFDIDEGGLGLSLFQSELRPTPYECTLLERHPLGSQCFVPMGDSSFFVIVAPDDNGKPGPISAFVAGPHQSVNIAKNTWHGVLAPISGTGLFAVLDRIGPGQNLEEYPLEEAVLIKK